MPLNQFIERDFVNALIAAADAYVSTNKKRIDLEERRVAALEKIAARLDSPNRDDVSHVLKEFHTDD